MEAAALIPVTPVASVSFRDPALKAHFEKQLGHRAAMVNVDAFLSEIERKNVEVLAAAEKTAQQPAESRRDPGPREP